MEQKLAALYQDQSVIAASAQLKSCWLRPVHIQLSAAEREVSCLAEKSELLVKSLIISFHYYCFLMSVHWCL